jgi:hypothetical protein
MNGVSSSLKDELKKTNESKLKTKIRFFSAIIISNALVALLCLPSQEVALQESTSIVKLHHPQFRIMVLPLSLLVSSEVLNQAETPVTLISADKKIIVKKAYLHQEVKTAKSEDPLFDGSLRHFKIEIPEADLIRVSAFLEKGVVAVPYVEIKNSKIPNRGSKYEVSF